MMDQDRVLNTAKQVVSLIAPLNSYEQDATMRVALALAENGRAIRLLEDAGINPDSGERISDQPESPPSVPMS